IIVLAIVGFITCGTATLMTYKRWLSDYVMYFIPVVVTVLTLLLIITGPIITTYFLVFVNLGIMTLYNNFRSLAFSVLLGAGLTVYLFPNPFKEETFGSTDPVMIIMYLDMVAAALLGSSELTDRVHTEEADQRELAIIAEHRTHDIIHQLPASRVNLD